jgi:hypothetical protein
MAENVVIALRVGCERQGGKSCCFVLTLVLVSAARKIINMNATSKASGALRLHADDAEFLTDDEVHKVIGEPAGTDDDVVERHASHVHRHGHLSSTKEALEAHRKSVVKCVSIPKVVLRDFIVHGPFGTVLVQSVFMTSKKRALLFCVDALGAVTVVTFFLDAGGSRARGENDNELCRTNFTFWAMFGRFLTIGVVACVISRLPTMFMSTIAAREFKHVEAVGSLAWHTQLRKWRCRDRVFWTCGILYIVATAHFQLLFFANVSETDQLNWIVSAAIQWAKDFLIAPILFSMVLPLLASILMCIVTVFRMDLDEDTTAGDDTQQGPVIDDSESDGSATPSMGAVRSI